MNIKEFAEILNGREYRAEITKEEEMIAKNEGMVVVFGASDDLCEFRGAIDDECDCYDGGTAYITENGLFEPCECNCKYSQEAKKKAVKLTINWNDNGEYAWTYGIDGEHEEFTIIEDGEPYCKGIVFNLQQVAKCRNE